MKHGTSPGLEQRIRDAEALLTSRLSLVETARAFHRLRAEQHFSEKQLADAEREMASVWAQCDVWEITPSVCDEAAAVAPRTAVRTLDAIHLATYLLARRRLAGVEMVTADHRLEAAVAAIQGISLACAL